MAREVVERAAGRDDVDEAEQRGLQLGVLGGELHRLAVGGRDRVARRRRQRVGEPAADLEQLRFQPGRVHATSRDCTRLAGTTLIRVREPGLLSVVAPMHDEEDMVGAFHARTVAALDGIEFELVLVDDGSRDGTGERLRALAAADERIKLITLSRNFGHQAALSAGLEHARGDVVVMIDGDLQDPPELIPEMLDAWRARRRRRLRGARVARGRDARSSSPARAGSTACSPSSRGSSSRTTPATSG